MEDWLVTGVSLIGSAIITAVVGIVVKRTMSKEFDKQNRLKEYEERDKANKRKEELQHELGLQLKPIDTKLNDIERKVDLSTNGTLSSLRNDILTCYYRCREKGYRNDYDFQNIHDLYDAYFSLGGNSFIKDVMDRFDNLPIKEDVKSINVGIYKKKSNKTTLNEKMKED